MFGGAETVVLSAKELVEPESLLVLLAKKMVEPEQLLTGLGPVVDFPAVSLAEDFLFLPKQDVVVDQQFPILMTNVKFEGTNQKSLEMIFLWPLTGSKSKEVPFPGIKHS